MELLRWSDKICVVIVSDDLQAPIYDFKVSKRVGYKTVKVPASRVVIVEGIYALSARIRLRPPSHTTN